MASPTISSGSRPAHVYGIGLVGLLALILAARLIALHVNATDLFFDEAQYWSWGEDPAFGYYSQAAADRLDDQTVDGSPAA